MGKHCLSLLSVAFLLVVSIPAMAEDDHGNSCASATTITEGSIDGTIEIGSDYDFFRVDIEDDRAFWGFRTISDLLDTYLCLMDSNCSLIECCDTPGCGISKALYSGTYYISVRSNGTDTGSYTLEVGGLPTTLRSWIVGTITDAQSGLPIKGAKVRTDIGNSAIAFADGRYLMAHQAGTFTITVEATRFHPLTYEGIKILEAEVKTVDFELIPLPIKPSPYLPLLLDD